MAALGACVVCRAWAWVFSFVCTSSVRQSAARGSSGFILYTDLRTAHSGVELNFLLFILSKKLFLILYSDLPPSYLWKLQVSQTLGLA